MSIFKSIADTILLFGSTYIAFGILMPLGVAMHELGHLVVAKIRGIPVYEYRLGSGRQLALFNLLGLKVNIQSGAANGGGIVVPRLHPLGPAGWRSIVMLTLAGPATNLLMIIAALSLASLSSDMVVRGIGLGFALANAVLVGESDNDYAMAGAAHRRDLNKLQSWYEGEEHPIFRFGA